MPKWLKVVLVVAGIGVLTCGLGVGGVTWWFNSNKDALKGKADKMLGEARTFAATSDSHGCLKEALARLKTNSGLMGEIEQRVFLTECLKVAAKSPDFCDDVPGRDEVLQIALWARQTCEKKYDGPMEQCGRMLQELPTYCAKAQRSR
jgi:hypothetical protein